MDTSSSTRFKTNCLVVNIEESLTILKEHCKKVGLDYNEVITDTTAFEYSVSTTTHVVENLLGNLEEEELSKIKEDPSGPYLSYCEWYECPLEEFQMNLEEELMTAILKLGWQRTKPGQSVSISLPVDKFVMVHV